MFEVCWAGSHGWCLNLFLIVLPAWSYSLLFVSSSIISYLLQAFLIKFNWNISCWPTFHPTDPSEELCREEKILYKLISGLHSSISVHIAAEYLLDETTDLVLTSLNFGLPYPNLCLLIISMIMLSSIFCISKVVVRPKYVSHYMIEQWIISYTPKHQLM